MPRDEVLRTAIAKAIEYCKRNDILTEFWQSLTQEEMNMLATEWNMEDALEVRFEEGLETGREILAQNALQEGLSIALVQKISGLSLERIQELQTRTTTSY
jgi:predicted transposase YdaD